MTSKCFLLSIELLFHSIAIIKNQSDLSEVVETKDRLVRHFETLIHAHAYKNNPVNWYAEQLNLSPRYLSNHCRQMAGIGPKKYITKHYLKLIKQWLLRSDKSVKQIAFENNISEAALCKLFKREVGITMTDYRSG